NLTEKVVESWKPVLASAIDEWVREKSLSMAIEFGRDDSGSDSGSRVETTPEELEGFATVQRLLGPQRPVAYKDTHTYFKIHLQERHTWVMCRLYFGKKRPTVWVPLRIDEAQPLAAEFSMSTPQKSWTSVSLDSPSDLDLLGDLLRENYDRQKAFRQTI